MRNRRITVIDGRIEIDAEEFQSSDGCFHLSARMINSSVHWLEIFHASNKTWTRIPVSEALKRELLIIFTTL